MIKSVPDILSERDFEYLQKYALEHHEALKKVNSTSEVSYGVLQISDTPELRMLHEKILPLARKVFNNESLIPTWQYIDIHSGPQSVLSKTFIEDAQYVVGLVGYQKLSWGITLGEEYVELSENEGLFFEANTPFTRTPFPDPFNNVVANAFFFFIQP